MKTLDILVRCIKNFKLWVRKGEEAEFVKSNEEVEAFAAEEPPVAILFPHCFSIAKIESSFLNQLPEILEKEKRTEIKEDRMF